MTNVCVLGSINMDLVVRSPRLPGPGETLLGGPFRMFPGGKGANQAVAASRLAAQGGRVQMVGAVGDDANGREHLAGMLHEGVDTSFVFTRHGTPTGVALITVAEAGGENTIVVAPGANATVSTDDVDAAAEAIRAADVLLMQLEVPVEAVVEAARIARASSTATVLNAAPARSLPGELLANVDVLVVNQSEAAVLSGLEERESPDIILDSLVDGGAATVILTLGDAGALAARRGPRGPERIRTPAHTVATVDTVGAGDAFCGAVAAAWRTLGDDLSSLLRFACAAGALATTRAGAIPSLPRRAEVEALVAGSGGGASGDRTDS